MNKTGDDKINEEQLWKMYTHYFRQICSKQGYVTYAKILHNTPYLFLVDKNKKDEVKGKCYARPLNNIADYVIEGRWDLVNEIYLFCLTKEKFPWEFIERNSDGLIYDPAAYARKVKSLLN